MPFSPVCLICHLHRGNNGGSDFAVADGDLGEPSGGRLGFVAAGCHDAAAVCVFVVVETPREPPQLFRNGSACVGGAASGRGTVFH